MAFGFFVVVASCINRLSGLADRGHQVFLLGLFFATVGRLIITAIGTDEFSYVVLVLVFVIVLIGSLLCYICKGCVRKRTQSKP